MSEIKLQSPPRQKVHFYVNPYTHDYEITDIPTKYQIQQIGYYVGSFFSYYPLSKKDVFHNTSYKIMDQSTLEKRYGEDGKRTNICFTCNKKKKEKKKHWARNCPDRKKKQTWTTVFVYVDPRSHELKILPTWRLGHQFQNMKYVGVLKSFCNECKINSPQITISVESQAENTEKYSMQNDSENTEKNSIQNDNTSTSDSEMCQFAEEMERDLRQGLTGSERSHRLWTIFKPVKKNQINSHQQKDLTFSEEKQQDSKKKKEQDIKNKKKRSYK